MTTIEIANGKYHMISIMLVFFWSSVELARTSFGATKNTIIASEFDSMSSKCRVYACVTIALLPDRWTEPTGDRLLSSLAIYHKIHVICQLLFDYSEFLSDSNKYARRAVSALEPLSHQFICVYSTIATYQCYLCWFFSLSPNVMRSESTRWCHLFVS